MRPATRFLHLTLLIAAAGVVIPGCGGRVATRAVDPIAPLPSPGPATSRRVQPVPAAVRVAGIYHSLERGQTLSSLSRAYGVRVTTLIDVNHITDPASIPAGTRIFIPGADRLRTVSLPTPSTLGWPLAGKITSGFGPRGRRSRHTGIDIDGTMGQRIRAAAGGTVIRVGPATGYGLRVVLDHGSGLTTLYAHASKLLVFQGEKVERGRTIARVGKSGNAKGTHLHFEVRRNDRPVNPLPYLGRR